MIFSHTEVVSKNKHVMHCIPQNKWAVFRQPWKALRAPDLSFVYVWIRYMDWEWWRDLFSPYNHQISASTSHRDVLKTCSLIIYHFIHFSTCWCNYEPAVGSIPWLTAWDWTFRLTNRSWFTSLDPSFQRCSLLRAHYVLNTILPRTIWASTRLDMPACSSCANRSHMLVTWHWLRHWTYSMSLSTSTRPYLYQSQYLVQHLLISMLIHNMEDISSSCPHKSRWPIYIMQHHFSRHQTTRHLMRSWTWRTGIHNCPSGWMCHYCERNTTQTIRQRWTRRWGDLPRTKRHAMGALWTQ